MQIVDCVCRGDTQRLSALLPHAGDAINNPLAPPQDLRTALHLAAGFPSLPCVQLLLWVSCKMFSSPFLCHFFIFLLSSLRGELFHLIIITLVKSVSMASSFLSSTMLVWKCVMQRDAQASSMPEVQETRMSLISCSKMVVPIAVWWCPPIPLPLATPPFLTPPLAPRNHLLFHGGRDPSAESQILINSKLVWYETVIAFLLPSRWVGWVECLRFHPMIVI